MPPSIIFFASHFERLSADTLHLLTAWIQNRYRRTESSISLPFPPVLSPTPCHKLYPQDVSGWRVKLKELDRSNPSTGWDWCLVGVSPRKKTVCWCVCYCENQQLSARKSDRSGEIMRCYADLWRKGPQITSSEIKKSSLQNPVTLLT